MMRSSRDPAMRHLRRALADLRRLDGFPNAADSDVLRASLPPRYTACPNPCIADFVGPPRVDESYRRSPFAADISEGRRDPIYRGQVYHTKVPPRAIARYIEHFAPPGGIVFDGFCGSGMTGVAARLTGRRAVLVDLSPAATAIAASYCLRVDCDAAARAFDELLARLEEECGWLYGLSDGREMNYLIWSEVYRCPHCSDDAPFSEMGFDFGTRRPTADITCPRCGEEIEPRALERVLSESGATREVPVRAAYRGQRDEREPGPEDLALSREVEDREIPYPHPDNWMMNREPADDGWGDMWRRGYHTGVRCVSDFYTKRTLFALAGALHIAKGLDAAPEVRHLVGQTIINTSINLTKMRRAYQGPVPLVLYLPRLRRECNVIRTLQRRFKAAVSALEQLPPDSDAIISTQSAASLPNIPDDCVDYIFTDPPFGQNIIYSEVNFLWESWMGITTAQETEAILSRGQEKGVDEYRDLMTRCFAEFRRILKPEHWMTVEFHNSKNAVWDAIQRALEDAGFVVEDVRILDKQQVSFKQASTENAVQKDLVISARKSAGGQLVLGFGEGDVWEWVAERLLNHRDTESTENGENGKALGERHKATLYGRLVQHWLTNGWEVPMDAAEFYAELGERFAERGGIYFIREEDQGD